MPSPLPFEADIHALEVRLGRLEQGGENSADGTPADVRHLRTELASMLRKKYASLTPWETVLVSRHPDRPQRPAWLSLRRPGRRESARLPGCREGR